MRTPHIDVLLRPRTGTPTSLVLVGIVATLASVSGCDLPIVAAEDTLIELRVPLLPVNAPAGAPPLEVSFEVPGRVAETRLLIERDGDVDVATGRFTVRADDVSTLEGIVRTSGRSAGGATAVLAEASLALETAPGAELSFTETPAWITDASGARPWLDLNRNGVGNLADFEAGCDPAVPGDFLRPSSTALQLAQDGGRALLTLENVLGRPLTVRVDVVDAPGVGVDVVEATRPATGLPSIAERRLLPGETLAVATSFGAVDGFLATGFVVARAVDDEGCGTSLEVPIRIFANIDANPRPPAPDDVEPSVPAVDDFAGFPAVDVVPLPPTQAASGLPLLVSLNAEPGDRFVDDVPAQAAFLVELPRGARLAAALTGAPFDTDLTLFRLDAQNVPTRLGGEEGDDAVQPPPSAGATVERAEVVADALLGNDPGPLRLLAVVGVPGTTEARLLPEALRTATASLVLRISTTPRFISRPDPAQGPLTGGTTVTFAGQGLRPEGQIFFGDALANCTISSAGGGVDDVSCTSPAGSLDEAAVDVVYVLNGQRAVLPTAFQYDPVTPRLDGTDPSVVVVDTDTTVTLRGFGFTSRFRPLQLRVGGAAPTVVQVLDDERVRFVAPRLEAGAVDIEVTVFGADDAPLTATLADGLLYVEDLVPAPVVDAVGPTRGNVVGGTQITITGSGFQASSRVYLVGDGDVVDDNHEAELLFAGATAIVAITPANAPGAVDLIVENADGQRGVLSDAFTYEQPPQPPPAVFSAIPNTGSTAGGQSVTILGADLDVAAVRFGTIDATVTSASGNAVVVTTPASAAGTVNIVVENNDGQTGQLTNGFTFLTPIVPPPQVFSLTPNTGAEAGGTAVTILGTGFQTPSVTFGGVAGTILDASESAIVLTTPAGNGPVDVVVLNGDGQSTRIAGGYLFADPVGRNPAIGSVVPAVAHAAVAGEVLVALGVDLNQVSAASVVATVGGVDTVLPATIGAATSTSVTLTVDVALPAASPLRVRLEDPDAGTLTSPAFLARAPSPQALDTRGRADEGNAFSVLVTGSDLNPDKISALRFTPLDPGSGAEVDLVPGFSAETVISLDLAGDVLGRGNWTVSVVYPGDVVFPVDVLAVGGVCPGSRLCETCGDNVVDPGEQCDGVDFGGETCVANGFNGGLLSCVGCQLDFNRCTVCGNGRVEDGEQCDGANIGGETCTSLGFQAGTLGCGNTCAFDTSACRTCGDGVCSTGETSSNCSADCPATCGNGSCDVGEVCGSCPRDCGTCPPYRLVLLSGDGQSGPITGTLSGPVRVRIVDGTGTPVQNADVSFQPPPGDALTALTRTTDSNGEAFVSWSLSGRVGPHDLTISATARDGTIIEDQPVNISATADDVATGTIIHVAGDPNSATGNVDIRGQAALRTRINRNIRGLAFEASGDLLILEDLRVLRVRTATGLFELVAGSPLSARGVNDAANGDGGLAVDALFAGAQGITTAPNGDIFVLDRGSESDRIRRIDAATGIITTIAGAGTAGQPDQGDNGPALGAQIIDGVGLARRDNGDLLVIQNQNTGLTAGRLRVLTFSETTPRARTEQVSLPGAVLQVTGPPLIVDDETLVIHSSNTFFLHQTGAEAIGPTFATSPLTSQGCLGPDRALYGVFRRNQNDHALLRHDLLGGFVTVAGGGSNGQAGDLGPATAASVQEIPFCAVNANGDVAFVNGSTLRRVRLIRGIASADRRPQVRVITGPGGGQTGLAGAGLIFPMQFTVESDVGGAFAPVSGAKLLVDVDQGGTTVPATVTSVGQFASVPVGLGRLVGAPDATASATVTARIGAPFDALYPGLQPAALSATIRLPAPGEQASYLTGTPTTGDGTLQSHGIRPALGGRLGHPWVTADGRVLVSSAIGFLGVWEIDGEGRVIHRAGNGETSQLGDGGPATEASVGGPVAVAEDDDGNLYIGGSANPELIRIVDTNGTIGTFAGAGSALTTPVDALALNISSADRLATTGDSQLLVGDGNRDVYAIDLRSRVANFLLGDGSCSGGVLRFSGGSGFASPAVARHPDGRGLLGVLIQSSATCPIDTTGQYLFEIVGGVLNPEPIRVLSTNSPLGIHAIGVAPNGNIFYIEGNSSGTRTLRVLTPSGTNVALSGFNNPFGLSVDPTFGWVYIYDGGNAFKVISQELP